MFSIIFPKTNSRFRIDKLVAVLLCGLLSLPASAHELDAYIQQVMRDWDVPGMAVAVVKDGEVVLTKGYGVRQLGQPAKVDENTIFGIGSMTKSFTAAAAALMVDRGKIHWQDSVVEHLPQHRFSDGGLTERVSLLDIAAHRVGVDADLPWMLRSWSTDDTLNRIKFFKPLGRYGDFRYSNTGTLALGKVVEAVSGKRWDDVIATGLFSPLRMTRSNTNEKSYVAEGDIAPCWVCMAPQGARLGMDALDKGEKNAASPHGLGVDGNLIPGAGNKKQRRPIEIWPWRYEPSITPAGAINSTANDMAKWLLFHLNQGKVKDRQLISREQMQMMHRQHVLREPGNSDPDSLYNQHFSDMGYGMNWDVSRYRGHRYVGHGGGQIGFGGFMWFVPEKQLGVFAIQNVDYRDAKAFVVVARALMDYYLEAPAADWQAYALDKWSPVREGRFAADVPLPKKNRTHRLEQPQTYAGRYYNEMLGEVELSSEKGKLVMRLEPLSVADLYSMGNNFFIAEFRGVNRWQISLNFSFGLGKKPQGFTFGVEGGASQRFDFARVD